MSAGDHQRSHWTKEKREQARKHAEKIRPLTKEWHASEEGRKWHKNHGVDAWNKRRCYSKNCSFCNTSFETKTYHQTFCSNKCKSASRRASGIDLIEVKCEFCKLLFKKDKNSNTTCCSKSCGRTLSWKKSKKH
jgi:hypothetical protein